jgi:hypothetical protein
MGGPGLTGLLKSVGEAGKTRQRQPKKRSLGVLNEHSETVFNEVLPTQVAFERPVIKKTPAKAGAVRGL